MEHVISTVKDPGYIGTGDKKPSGITIALPNQPSVDPLDNMPHYLRLSVCYVKGNVDAELFFISL